MYFKLALREFKSNWFMNIIIIIQMVIVFFSVTSAVSIADYFYQYYNNFREYYESEGYLYYMNGVQVENDRHRNVTANDSAVVEQQLKKADVVSCYSPWAEFSVGGENEIGMYTIAYDHEIIDAYEPQLSEGRWLEWERDDGIVEAVISENTKGINVGDEILMYNSFMNEPEEAFTVKIVGKLMDGSRIVGVSDVRANDNNDYRAVYFDYYVEAEEKPAILLSVDQISRCMEKNENLKLERFMSRLMFVRFHEDITQEERIHNERWLGMQVLMPAAINMSEIRANSSMVIKERLLAVLPVFIGLFILTIISAMCTCAISIKRQMKDYLIYSVCGMPWNRCIWITMLNSLLINITAMVICIAAVIGGTSFRLFDETTISMGLWQIMACVAVAVLYMLLSAILPFTLINGTSLNDVMRNDE